MMKVKVRRVGAALVGAASVVAVAGCAAQTAGDATASQHEVSLGSASGAYSPCIMSERRPATISRGS